MIPSVMVQSKVTYDHRLLRARAVLHGRGINDTRHDGERFVADSDAKLADILRLAILEDLTTGEYVPYEDHT